MDELRSAARTVRQQKCLTNDTIMDFFCETKIKSTRKPCRCYWCGEQIPTGSSKVYTASVYEGDFGSASFHPECNEARNAWQKETGELEWPEEGSMKRGTNEER